MRYLVYDHGFFLELALTLGRLGHKVYYCYPWEDAQSKIDKRVVGDGFDEIIRVAEPWGLIDAGEIDVAVFPDVHHGEMQLHIERCGIPVFGSRLADKLELNKIAFKKLQRELGMNAPEFDVVTGIEELRDHCRNETDRWIKTSPQYRGNIETFRHLEYEASRAKIDGLAIEFGPLQEQIRFLSEKPIDAHFESGLDTYIIDGTHPGMAVMGYEAKDSAYFATVMPYSDMPKEVTGPTDLLLDTMAKFKYRNWHSSEVKITENGESFLLEPTCRQASPAGEEQLEIYKNLDVIIAEGSKGVLVEPDIAYKFACEAMIEHHGDETHWMELKVPDSVRRWIKLYNTVKVGKVLGIKPGQSVIGAVVGVGDSPTEALDHLKENAEAIKDQPVTVHSESLATLLREIQEAQDAGIHFTSKPIPEPGEALDSAS